MRIHQDKLSNIKGFTVVELLVVIVVIGILAGITIVFYSSWQSDTNKTSLDSDLRQVAGYMQQRKNSAGTYPSSLDSSDIKLSNGSVYVVKEYGRDSFCVEGTKDGLVLKVSNLSKDPSAGTCTNPRVSSPTILGAKVDYCYWDGATLVVTGSASFKTASASEAPTYQLSVNDGYFGTFSFSNTSSTQNSVRSISFSYWMIEPSNNELLVDLSLRAGSASSGFSPYSSKWRYQLKLLNEMGGAGCG